VRLDRDTLTTVTAKAAHLDAGSGDRDSAECSGDTVAEADRSAHARSGGGVRSRAHRHALGVVQPGVIQAEGVVEDGRAMLLAGALVGRREPTRLAVHDAKLVIVKELPLNLEPSRILLVGQGAIVALVYVVIADGASELRHVTKGAHLRQTVGVLGGGIRAAHHIEEVAQAILKLLIAVVKDLLEARVEEIRKRGLYGRYGHWLMFLCVLRVLLPG